MSRNPWIANGEALILVEKRTYHPAGWAALTEKKVQCRITPKRVSAGAGMIKQIFDRASGEEIQTQDCRIHANYRFTLISAKERS